MELLWLADHASHQFSRASPDQNRLECSVFKVLFTPIQKWAVPLCLKYTSEVIAQKRNPTHTSQIAFANFLLTALRHNVKNHMFPV